MYEDSLSTCSGFNYSPGPTAPLHWVEECILSLSPKDSLERQKILVGINFYGYDYSTVGMEGLL